LALQFAYHIGSNPIYLLGLDFNYGSRYQVKLKDFQGQTVRIDEELLDILKETHFSNSYRKLSCRVMWRDFFLFAHFISFMLAFCFYITVICI
jgi:hypothetical protein